MNDLVSEYQCVFGGARSSSEAQCRVRPPVTYQPRPDARRDGHWHLHADGLRHALSNEHRASPSTTPTATNTLIHTLLSFPPPNLRQYQEASAEGEEAEDGEADVAA